VTASADGFQPQTKSDTVSENETTTVDFALDEAPPTPTLSVTVTTNKPSYVNRETVAITVHVTDGTNAVPGAAVHVEIATPNGKFVLAGDSTTDEGGDTILTHKVNSKRDGTGTYTVDATASKEGFISGNGSTTFVVTK